jgi:HK97 family phage portal protein
VTILRNLLGEGRSVENPLLPLTSTRLISVLGGQTSNSGVEVNEHTAAQKYIALYRAITLIAGAIAGLPFESHRIGVRRERFRSLLLEKPNPDMTRMEVWEWLLCSLLSAGHAFALKGYDANDRVSMLDPVAPDRMRVRRVSRTEANPRGKEFDLRKDNGEIVKLTPREILHIPGPMGLSPIGVARQSIGGSLATEEYAGKLFANGTLSSGILETEQKLTQDQATALKQRWQEKIAGLAHAHEIAVLDSGAKYHQISISPADAQLIEQRKFNVTEIARLYGIPPHMLAEQEKSTSWGTGIEQQAIGFVVFTLRPWLIRVEQRISDECLPRGVEAHFHTEDLTLGDAKTRAEVDLIGLQNGVKHRNEVRVSRGLPPVQGGDNFMVPMNMAVLDDNGVPLSAEEPEEEPSSLLLEQQERLSELRSYLDARFMEWGSREPVVNIHPANVNVTTPDVRIEEGAIRVDTPVTVEPAQITVPPSEIRVEQARRTVRKDVEHDDAGRIVRVTETEEPE